MILGKEQAVRITPKLLHDFQCTVRQNGSEKIEWFLPTNTNVHMRESTGEQLV